MRTDQKMRPTLDVLYGAGVERRLVALEGGSGEVRETVRAELSRDALDALMQEPSYLL